MSEKIVFSRGSFFHGTRADLKIGDLIVTGKKKNYNDDRKSEYVYFAGTLDAAVWGAELAEGEGEERIYVVEPTGDFEDDPNVADKKFPGSPTKLYRSKHPLKIVAEVINWEGHSPERLNHMLKIALLQIAPCKNSDENLEKGIMCCKKAKEKGADIALFPEMWSNGYNIYNRPVDKWKKEAIPVDSDFINTFRTLAKQLHMAIGITLLEKYENAPRNSLALFDRYGELKFVYAKVHTCDFDVERNLTAGEDFYVATLDTSCGKVKVGAMICYDREFPESARVLMLKGAELILVPNACPMEINRLSQLRGRAFENMLAIATCNYPKTVPACNGNSSVFDGVAYLPDETSSRDTCIFQAGEEEGIYISELDLEQLRSYRESEVHGNAYRHPQKYKLLTESKIDRPFIRSDYRE